MRFIFLLCGIFISLKAFSETEEAFAIYPKHPFDVDQVAVIYVSEKHPQLSVQKDLKGALVAWLLGYNYDHYFPELK